MKKHLLVCDLDNTVYDWVGYFVPSFYAMVDEVVRLTGCDRERLLDDFKAVHQRHHDSEHPFSLLETDTVRRLFANSAPPKIVQELSPAFRAFNAVRNERLRLYPGVVDTLEALRAAGIKVVAHTESKLFGVIDRLTRFGLTDYFDQIYCRERSQSLHPDERAAASLLERFPLSKVVELSMHQRKPDPTVLLEICARHESAPSEAAYIGDSIARDVLMARRAGVTSIWAKYGVHMDAQEYDMLVRVTHWTTEDVARERQLRSEAKDVEPNFVLEHGFDELLEIFELGVSSDHTSC